MSRNTEKDARRRKTQSDRIEIMDLDKEMRDRGKKDRQTRDKGTESRPKKDVREPKKSKKSGRNREFLIITYLFLAIFLIMIAYLVYFQVMKSDTVISSSYNKRQDLYAERVIRGDIMTSDGAVVATTSVDEDSDYEIREYPYDRMFAHVVGYFNNGKSGIEGQYNFTLLRTHAFILKQIYNDLVGQKCMGDTVITTLDYDVQEAAYNALGDQRGAVVVLEAKTGKVLGMVSKPDFNPNTLPGQWDDIVNDSSSTVLLNRATNGLYPPGSIFKVFTTLEYIHENSKYDNYSFNCEGKLSVDDNEIHCYHNNVHGQENLMDSFANSCNTSYATIGLSLSLNRYENLMKDMMFNQKLPGNIPSKNSSFTLSSGDGKGKVMQTAIGQGDTLVSPLHMALVAAAIDNDGTVQVPYLVDTVVNENGATVRKYHESSGGSLMSSSDAGTMRQFMDAVVDHGTATALSGQSYHAGGKTGSAEYDSNGNSHGWFIGYGSKEGYEDIAIAVIVENGGSGSSSAVPVAKWVFDVYFNQ